MEEVTQQVLAGVTAQTGEAERDRIIERNIKTVGDKAVQGTHYKYVIKPFYYGNQYFMYVNEVFTDVRLVGTPPSNIGSSAATPTTGVPRHTGDFRHVPRLRRPGRQARRLPPLATCPTGP